MSHPTSAKKQSSDFASGYTDYLMSFYDKHGLHRLITTLNIMNQLLGRPASFIGLVVCLGKRNEKQALAYKA